MTELAHRNWKLTLVALQAHWFFLLIDDRSNTSHSVSVDDFIIGDILAIKDVMLEDEQNVEKNREEPKAEFGHVAKNALPIVVVVSLQKKEQR